MRQPSPYLRHKAEFFRPRTAVHHAMIARAREYERGIVRGFLDLGTSRPARKTSTVLGTLFNVIAVSVVCAVIIGAMWLLLLEAWMLWG